MVKLRKRGQITGEKNLTRKNKNHVRGGNWISIKESDYGINKNMIIEWQEILTVGRIRLSKMNPIRHYISY